MGLRRYSVTVDADTYDLRIMDCDAAIRVRRILFRTLGQALTELFCTIEVESIEELFGTEITPKMAAAVSTAAGEIFKEFTGEEYIFVRNSLLDNMLIDGNLAAATTFPVLFAGKLLHLDKLLIAAIRENFEDFFGLALSVHGRSVPTEAAEQGA